MDRIKDVLSKVNYIATVLLLLGIRAIVDANLAQALIVCCFSGLYGYMKYLESVKIPDANAEIKSELEKLRSNMSAIMIKSATKTEEQPFRRMF